jgi:hypothetical protein
MNQHGRRIRQGVSQARSEITWEKRGLLGHNAADDSADGRLIARLAIG